MLKEYSFGDIYIRHAIDNSPDEKEFNMHIHDRCEIYFFISGNVEYLVEGSKYPLNENSLMIMRPAEAHSPKITGSS
ncbi:MAG: AraC family ligand binding domain-containing protein, partial [Oscillospiraceae bacterium]|nr:AraC family ligand binding domain-containing protein [Oscillospiraceae bacterium]